TRRRPEIDAVVAPAEAAGKFVNGHHLERVDADLRERRQMLRCRAPRSFARESPDVHFVNDAAIDARISLAPSIRIRIDDFGGAVRTFRLESRRRIGKYVAAIEPKSIARSCARTAHDAAKVAVAIAIERVIAIVDYHRNVAMIGR